MGNKNYGPGVSGYLDPTGRGWETAVFQAGKPVLDKELNLGEDIASFVLGTGKLDNATVIPNGWVSPVGLDSTYSPWFFVTSPTANTLQMIQPLVAKVGPWVVPVVETNTTGANIIDLGAAPVGAGVKRTDLVILEVWRKLISASPDTDGKSALGLIWQYGNVKTDPANDAVLNFPDDILDGVVGAETTKRVQIQYRLRVIQGVDLFAYPYGIDDPTVVANTVPAAPAAPDGVPTAFPYVSQANNGFSGLWAAGDGDPTNALGTVDGYMYAIPLCAVFRRNQTAFDKDTNHNGGVASPGPSDRPDGLFYDIIDAEDIASVGLNVSLQGYDFAEVLQKNVNWLLDNQLRTEWMTTPNGGGVNGHTVLWADEVGNNDTPGATLIADFDMVRRRFSDRPIYETVTVIIRAADLSVPGAWASGLTFEIDPTSMRFKDFGLTNWASHAPADVQIIDVQDAWWQGGAGAYTGQATAYLSKVTDLATSPVSTVHFTVGDITTPLADGLTNEDIYIDLLICYPSGCGLTRTPTADFGNATFAINDPLMFPAAAPFYYDTFTHGIDYPHREVLMQYTTLVRTFTASAAGGTFVKLPERAASVTTVTVNAVPDGAATLSADARSIALSAPAAPGDTIVVTYHALRPIPVPNVNDDITVYYQTRAPQTARVSLLGTNLPVTPRLISSKLYSITTGSGSLDEGYPWPYAYVQTGGIYNTSAGPVFSGEHELDGRAEIAITDFSAETGLLDLPVFVPYVPNPQEVVLGDGFGPALADCEDRSFFPVVPVGGVYVPNAYAQDLSDPKRHKVVMPMLAELPDNSPLGCKGQFVIVLFTRWATFDPVNGFYFDPVSTQNTTTASVFRPKNNLLYRGF